MRFVVDLFGIVAGLCRFVAVLLRIVSHLFRICFALFWIVDLRNGLGLTFVADRAVFGAAFLGQAKA